MNVSSKISENGVCLVTKGFLRLWYLRCEWGGGGEDRPQRSAGGKAKSKWRGEQKGDGMRMGCRARLGLLRTPDKPDPYTPNFDQLLLFILRDQVDTQWPSFPSYSTHKSNSVWLYKQPTNCSPHLSVNAMETTFHSLSTGGWNVGIRGQAMQLASLRKRRQFKKQFKKQSSKSNILLENKEFNDLKKQESITTGKTYREISHINYCSCSD